MANPGQLVSTVAEVIGVARPTVKEFDNAMRRAGYRNERGRGPSAAVMTPQDGAALMIALSGATHIKDGVKAFETFAPLRAREGYSSEGNTSQVETPGQWRLIPALRSLSDDHSFHDALSALISAAAQGDTTVLGTMVRMFGPHPRAELRVLGADFSEAQTYRPENVFDRNATPDCLEVKACNEASIAAYGNGDLTTVREFSGATLMEIGALLRDEGNRFIQ